MLAVPLPTCNPSHRALASPPSPSLNERPGHTQPRLLAFNLFTGSLRLSHVIDNGNGGGGSGDGGGSGSGGGCRPRNVSLGGAAVEIKHFNYSRLVGGASHRKQSCDKDRWKKKRVWARAEPAGRIISAASYIPLTWMGLCERVGRKEVKNMKPLLHVFPAEVIVHRCEPPPPLAFPSSEIALAANLRDLHFLGEYTGSLCQSSSPPQPSHPAVTSL